ncbi:gonadotropin-releasing hormone receptor [Chelonus insularis]|uniref:gonadotropin-releasing hormone receptor n=1 Tax=Chelonus insularis TaxID=460826 RepID=UPI00158D9AF2|nr:gonadotropin-releasing hormone receptor [Chelonus insularis]XP_034942994.1 gonadotropin-releasing hormone receptor [Chelonus insularis]
MNILPFHLINSTSDVTTQLLRIIISGVQNDTNMSNQILNGSMFNLTHLEHAPSLTHRAFIKAIVLGVMAALSLVANATTIWSITKNRRKHQSYSAIYTLIFHLSIADLLVTIFCIAGEALWSYTVAWIWGNVTCKIFKFLQMFSLYLSTFVLVLIGVDRFVAVRYPMKSLNTSERCTKLVLITWIVSGLLSIPQLIIFHVARGPFVEEFSQCVTHGFYTEAWQEQLYTTLSLILMFILPLTVLIVTYVSTIITISRSEKSFKLQLTNHKNISQESGDTNRRKLMHRAKSKSLRISIVIVAAFVLWWTPYYTMMIIFMFLNPDERLSEELQNGIFFFGMSNSLVNPLIYGAFHLWPQKKCRKFRQRDGSTMQHRSTATHTSFTLATRGYSSRFTQSQTRKSSTFNGILHATDETVLVKLINEGPNNNEKVLKQSPRLILQYNSNSNGITTKLINTNKT